MKQSSKPLIVVITSILILVTIIILIAQGIRLKYEELQRELAQLENMIKTEKNFMVGLKANYQMLTAEDLVKKYAILELGLIDNSANEENKITLLKSDIIELSENAGMLDE
jgi:cell division protein FtsL